MTKYFGKCKKYYRFGEPTQAKVINLYPYFKQIDGEQNPLVKMENRDIIMLGSNNYLGMSSNSEVKEAAIDAIRQFGVGTTGSRLLNGTMTLHIELEKRLANFIGTEDCVVFSTGMQANLGGISSLISEKDEWIISDQQNHASIIDGIRLAKMEPKNKKIYAHNDMDDLKKCLSEVPKGKGLIITDGIFSMEGDVAPLDQIIELAEDYGAGVYVDDAHSVGVLGPYGKGTAAHFNKVKEVDVTMGTFSKSFATCGGFLAADKSICNWIRHKARAFIFSASPPPAVCASVIKILDIIENDDSYVKHLHKVSNKMREGLREAGFNIGKSTTPIIPIIIGNERRALKFYKRLFEHKPYGVFTNPVRAPATPPGRELLRTSYMATMDEELIDQALDIFIEEGKKINII